ncbi:hypothetical protein L1049_015545 [Liquidambar formosana]|uniref:Neprosin PEP catalytic domain-containing protein n=1 Tax=Liquidambar formosana TaxID=63359 RepID=A0AAP0S4D1_LIQFO
MEVQDEQSSRNWWLYVNEGQDVVGYWPGVIFTGLSHAADTLRWGGQVFTPLSDDVSPPMGSGVFENGRYDRTCYMRKVVVVNGAFDTESEVPDESSTQVAESRCYFEADQSYKDDYWEYI